MELLEEKAALGFAATIIVTVVALGAYTLGTPLGTPTDRNTNSAGMLTMTTVRSTTSSVNFLYGLMYLTADSGCFSGPSPAGPWSPSPCFGPRSDAVVFNCMKAAATSQGCTQRVYYKGNASESYVVTVWYPYFNSTANSEGYNCKLAFYPETVHTGYAYCMSVNSTSFLVAQPSPPPP